MSAPRAQTLRRSRHGRSQPRAGSGTDIQRHTRGTSLGAFPLVNLVVLELGAAAGLLVLAAAPGLWPLAAAIALAAAALGCARRRGRWLTERIAVGIGYLLRSRSRSTVAATTTDRTAELAPAITGADDARVTLLRLWVDDLLIAGATSHDQRPIGLSWHRGTWTAALLIDPSPMMISPVGPHTDLPLAALADCLQDRGVVLESIGVLWHCYPGSSRLPADSAAVAAYHEVLGPLPAVAQRSTWVTVRMDPRRCPGAVHERGGGVAGAHRALIGAVSRVQGALGRAGLNCSVLSAEELLRSALSAAELTAEVGRGAPVELRERWDGVRAGNVEHAAYAVRDWPVDSGRLDALTSIRALSTTVALTLSTGTESDNVGLRGVVRVSARTAEELAAADERVAAVVARTGIGLTRLNGQHAAAVASTLPVGGTT